MKRHLLLIAILLCSFTGVYAQTLYWVGGSGNFNDPSHWSLTSGGASANSLPNSSSDVIFDNKSGSDVFTVEFSSFASVKSFHANNTTSRIIFKNSAPSVLNVQSSFQLSSSAYFEFTGDLNFKSFVPTKNSVNFSLNTLKCNVSFNEGNYNIYPIRLSENNKITFKDGNYYFRYSSLTASDVEVKGNQTKFIIDTSYFNISNSFIVQNNPSFTANKFGFYAPFSETNKVKLGGVTFNSNSKLVDNKLNAVCQGTITTLPECGGSCTGSFTLNIDATCTGTYNLAVGGTTCTTTENNIATSGLLPGATYTVGNLCACGTSYAATVFDITTFIPIPLNTSNFNFTPPSYLLNTLAFIRPSCFTSCNGSMTLSIAGGTPPYTITVLPAISPPITSAAGGFTIGGMCGNTVYTFTMTDKNGCQGVSTKSLAPPPQLVANGTTQSITCFGACTGSSQISPTGGTPGYTVNWSTGASVAIGAGGTSSLTSLCASVSPISATVTDANGCPATYTSTVLQPTAALTATQSQTNVTCGGLCNASAQVNASGGTPGYSYTWTPVPGGGQGTPLASALCGSNVPAAANHTVTIMDLNQCVITRTFAITQPPPITLTPTFTNATCNATCNGSANAGQSGGTPPFTFTWSPTVPTQTTATATGLCAGIYTIAVTDNSTCVNQATVQITQPPPITLTVAQTSITCFGQCTGSSTATAIGGNGGFTYTWTAPTPSVIAGQGTATVSGLCAGLYTLTVRDASNCPIPIATFSITQPTQINPGITTTTITCNSLCNGIINSSPTGGTGPYNYTLASTTFTGTVTNSTTAQFTGLCGSFTAGIYTLSISDVTGTCIRTQTVNLLQPNPFSVTASTSSITCFGGCNASLSGSPVGGSPPYTYTWTSPAPATFNTPIINGQCAGTYTLDVRDVNGCTTQTIVTVVEPSSMTVALTPASPSCFSNCNGSITSTVSGGTPTYTYNWSTGASGSGGPTSISGLCAGNYSLTITDANGCQITSATTVVATPSIVITTTAVPTNCAGSCDGQAFANATGGTSPFVYSWNTLPVTTNTTGVLSGVCIGNYIVTVTDANGCIQNANVTITSPPVLSVAVNSVVPSCNICIGAATVTPAGGNPTYSYTWSPAPGSGQGTPTPGGLCVGVYTVLVSDTKGCTATRTINVSQSVIVNITTTGTVLTCNNDCNGIANANPSGGTLPYSYTWSPVGGNSQTATGLCAGSYTVNVVDALGCINSNTVTFNNPPAISVTSTITNPNCSGSCDGVINVTATGGTGPLSYTWSPVGGNSPNATNLCAGVYTLDIRDANNCLSSQIFTVTSKTPITAGFFPVSPTTCGGTNGTITAFVSGGTPNYSYTWTPSAQTTSVLTNVGAGAYTLTVLDAAGCTQTLVATLSDPTGPTVTVTSSSVTCFGSCNGSATVNVIGTAPININWPFPISSTNSVVTGLCQGTFAVNVSDATNCLISQTISVTEPPTFSLNPIVTNPSCGVACDGTITTSPAGGTAPYSYTWSPGATTSPTLSNICGGTYTANITDGNSCVYSQTFLVTQPTSITVTFTNRDALCNGVCSGTATAIPSGGTGPYTFSWTPVGSFTGSVLNNIINLCANIYTVTVTDANNCVTTATVLIDEPPVLNASLNFADALCNSQCNGSATVTAGGGTPTYSYNWTGSASTSSIVTGLCAGNYSNTITDANGCTLTQSFVINSPASISVTLTPTNPSCNGVCSGSITTLATGGTGALTYSWIATGSGQNPTGLCAGNYTVIVEDANGCTGQNVTVLTNPPSLLANATFTNPSCPAACNGVAISNPASGTAPFSYTWTTIPTQTTQAVSSLCSGTYSVIVMDNNFCVDTQQVVLVAPTTLTINPAASPASCGVCNGSLNVIALGGTPNYTLTWNASNPAPITGTAGINLCAGIYSVTLTDANSCASNFLIPISNSNGPSGATVTFTDVACNGQCNGSASVTNPIGGTPGYTVTWVSPSTTVNPISSLCAGTYTAQITDALGCILFQSVPINEPAVLNPSTTISQPLCSGNCNGTITSSPTGGTAAYTYSWSTGATTSSVTNICPGNYTLTVTDAQSCVATQTFNILGTINITASSVAVNNTCFGNCNGSLLATSVAGGLPPYSYNWSDPLGQSTAQAFNLCNGNYFLVITDAQGCFDTIRGNVTSPAALTLTNTTTQPACGLCNGSSTVSALGGVGPYTYTWSSGSSTATEANLCAGIYMVTITDNNGCLQNVNVPINNSSTLTETITSTNETCFGQCNGSATVTAGGGTAPITYNWLSPSSTSQSVASLCAGTYFVQMTDAMGCIINSSVNISSANDLTVTPFVTQPGCTVTTGSISLTVTGGNPGYSYLWSPGGATTSSVTGLGVGTYTVVVTDLSGCSKTIVLPLTNVNAPVFNLSSVNALCNGTCNAVASLSVTSGTAPFTFNWSTGTISSGVNTSTATGLCSGVVTATVTSIDGCLSVQSATLSQPPQLLMSLPNLNTPDCNNDCNGSINVIPSGGVLPYTYTWTPSGSTNPITNLCAGNYASTVTDANGCSVTSTYTLLNPAVLTLSANIVNSTCNTALDGAITTTVNGGLPVYTYTWTGPGTFTSNASSINNVLSGTYSLTLIDFAGCRKDTTMIIVPTVSVLAVAGSDSSFCQSGSFVLNGSSSTGGTTYQWFQLPSAVSFTNTLIATVNPPIGTSTFVLVATNGVCIHQDTVQITSNIPPFVDAGPNYTITIFTSTVIGGSPTSPTGVTYTWIPSTTLDNGSLSNPIASNTVNTSYTVMVTDINGCTASDTMHVHIFPEIFIPNGFSNNGDGKNDFWVIDNIQQFPENVVEVYNRWGELLFRSEGYTTPWDGKYNGKDLPVGTYYYIIDLHHVNFPKAYTGPLTIFR